MESRTNCWVDLSEVKIPPLEKKGFQENVIIRKKVEPIVVKRPEEPVEPERYAVEQEGCRAEIKDSAVEEYSGEAVTVLIRDDEDEYDGESATVLLSREDFIQVYLKRQKTGEIFRVDKERFVIGKSVRADYVIKDNPTVSRQHAAIVCTNGEYFLEDLQSANKTYVDGEAIFSPVTLKNGMTFTLASDEAFEFSVTLVR